MNLIPWLISFVIILLFVIIPRVGLLARYKDLQAARSREQVEDALKHLLDRERTA